MLAILVAPYPLSYVQATNMNKVAMIRFSSEDVIEAVEEIETAITLKLNITILLLFPSLIFTLVLEELLLQTVCLWRWEQPYYPV
uniref:Uncharacterized protein n=1 Tax=Engystomops pustulosus TaxID=76066 RepID=A0AAV6YK67_ENGPU|nr:hypothetical protein GDO81_023744 [Engystomops pustulosus]